MKSAPLLFILSLILSGAVLAGDTPTLYVYTWEDYFPGEEIEAFERKHDCRVEFDYYDSNEVMLEKLAEGGGYDIVTPPPNLARTLFTMRRLKTLDHGLLPNLENIDRESSSLTQDPKLRYSVPYTVTVTGIGYNKTMVTPGAADSWAVFGDERIGKRMTMLNDMREIFAAALKYLGHSLNTIKADEINAAGDVLRKWKKNIALFDVELAKTGLNDGTYAVIQAYSGDVAKIMESNPNIDFSVPKEGAAINGDTLAIASDSENPDLAHAFINHFLDANVAKNTMLSIRYYMPNKAARELMDDAALQHVGFNLSGEVRDKCESVLNLGAVRNLYDKAWEEVLLSE